jgi:hypothetical protein
MLSPTTRNAISADQFSFTLISLMSFSQLLYEKWYVEWARMPACGATFVSVNVGLPRDVPWHRRIVTTGIFSGGRYS